MICITKCIIPNIAVYLRLQNYLHMNKLIVFLALSLIIACKPSTAPNDSPEAQEASQDGKYESFGEVITDEDMISYDDLLGALDSLEEFEGKVRGTVEGVCQAKGCWMNIVSETDSTAMFVKFKDYGFFMPKDIAGKEVIMRGRAYKEETSVEELRHYAEDEGKSEEEIAAITEPIVELKFMADGVLLVK